MGGEFVGEWTDTCICAAESLCGSPKTITTLLIGYTPLQNKVLKKKSELFASSTQKAITQLFDLYKKINECSSTI